MAKRLNFDEISSSKEGILAEAKRQKGGRPVKKGEKATHKLTIYLTPMEAEMLNAYSERTGVPKATIAKRELLKMLG